MFDKYKESYFHERKIPAGEYGKISKIVEESYEALDAKERGHKVMLIIELADIVGAVMGVCDNEGVDIDELIKFNELRSEVYAREGQINQGDDRGYDKSIRR